MKTSISFGLVHIPITLQVSAKRSDVSFNMLDKKTMSRIKYKKTCTECEGQEVEAENIIKGYQYEKNKYVVFEESELENLKTKKDKTISVDTFVSLDSIDPLYYDKAYYVSPRENAEKPFALLKTALKSSGKVGIAKTMLGTKEVLVALRVSGDNVILNTMFFQAEVTSAPTIKSVDVGEKELDMAKILIDALSGDFLPDNYQNEYQARLKNAITLKVEGKDIVSADVSKDAKVINLMEALEQSLKELESAKQTAKQKTQPKTKKKA
ncbi:MAG: Ku protein [Firmicutes bacterium]|nr:Ku protein [Bacillota bacterium]